MTQVRVSYQKLLKCWVLNELHKKNLYISPKVEALWAKGYKPADFYQADPQLRAAMDLILQASGSPKRSKLIKRASSKLEPSIIFVL